MRSDYSPDAAFTLPARVRSYEAGRNRRISLGTTLRLLEFLATEASSALGFAPEWYVEKSSAWLVREMRIVLGDLPTIGDELLLGTWLSEWRKVQAYREYAIRRPGSDTLVARARARWAYVDRNRGVPLRVPDEMIERFSPLGPPMRQRRSLAPIATSSPTTIGTHTMRLTARETEADVNQHINNTVYADWLSEALYRALDEWRFPLGDYEILPREYQIEYLRPTLPGDRMRLETTLEPRWAVMTGHRRDTARPYIPGQGQADVFGPARLRALTVTQRILDEASAEPVVRAASRHLLLPRR